MEYLDAVHGLAEEVGRAAGLSRSRAFELGMAVREAFVNAITHGNRLDPRKKVRLSFRVREAALRVCIGDEGSGFDPGATPDPLAPENLTRPEGRGILLIRHYVDRLEVRRTRSGGAKICMSKRLEAAAHRGRPSRRDGQGHPPAQARG